MHRNYLKTGDRLTLYNFSTGSPISLKITANPLGRGHSSIVYEAVTNDDQLPCKYRLKELYPSDIPDIHRDENNQLIINDSSSKAYFQASERFDKAMELLWKFAYSDSTGCYTVCPLGKFKGSGGALYLITQWLPSDYVNTASLCGMTDIATAVRICLKTACAAAEFHKAGYINLDIKPENILYHPKTDSVAFFDTDTIIEINSDIQNSVFFSEGAAPEISGGYASLFSEKSDVFSIGSMLHRFITRENYFSGQYSLDISLNHNQLNKYDMLKNSAPAILTDIMLIFKGCCQGNPASRMNMTELAASLNKLDSKLSGQTKVNPPQFTISDVDKFAADMKKMRSTSVVLGRFYKLLFLLCSTAIIITVFTAKTYSVFSNVFCIILIAANIILRSIIFKRTELAAICRIREENCREHFKAAYEFGNSPNNHQMFEISAPQFISETENKRHKSRLILGTAAITMGAVTAVISLLMNSFPVLIAAWLLIIAAVFWVDYICYIDTVNKMYNDRFGPDSKGKNRKIDEIYRMNSDSDIDIYSLDTECIRLIVYNEYKNHCNNWGTADVLCKLSACCNIFFLLIKIFSLPLSEYLHLPVFISAENLVCFFIITFCIGSIIMSALNKRFCSYTKRLLFAVNSEDEAFLKKEFLFYTADSRIKEISFARGIYNHALMFYEKGIPAHMLPRSEQPTFRQYCISQNARTRIYHFLILISVISFFVWHMEIYSALLPIVFLSFFIRFIWVKYLSFTFNRIILGINNHETDK